MKEEQIERLHKICRCARAVVMHIEAIKPSDFERDFSFKPGCGIAWYNRVRSTLRKGIAYFEEDAFDSDAATVWESFTETLENVANAFDVLSFYHDDRESEYTSDYRSASQAASFCLTMAAKWAPTLWRAFDA